MVAVELFVYQHTSCATKLFTYDMQLPTIMKGEEMRSLYGKEVISTLETKTLCRRVCSQRGVRCSQTLAEVLEGGKFEYISGNDYLR